MSCLLETKALNKSFGAMQATKDVSITLNTGEIHALIGPNGAGKSTLIKQIAGGLTPNSGKVLIEGRDVTKLDTVARARMGLARTFQISTLAMEHSVLENVMLGAIGHRGDGFRLMSSILKNAEIQAAAVDALIQVGLADHAQTRCSDLSHGQRRQLEVAVALTLKPKLFLMDEPMAGLGSEGTSEMTRFLDSLRTQAPILLVEHDMDAVFALADRISVLVYGEIIATGTADDIRAHPEVRSAYLGEEAPL